VTQAAKIIKQAIINEKNDALFTNIEKYLGMYQMNTKYAVISTTLSNTPN
jgi:hypothetical protein